MRGIVITGASSGLGAALARAYARPEVVLALLGRDRARLEAEAAHCQKAGAETVVFAADVADATTLAPWLVDFDRRCAVDLIIANAGTSSGLIAGRRAEGIEGASRQVRTNLLGAMNTIEPLLPGLLARGRGSIAIIASIAGFRGLPYSPGYCASKAGLRAYGEALRALLAPAGIKVSVVSPGFFSSPMTDRWSGPTPFLMPLDRAAEIVKRGIDRGRGRVTFPLLLALGMRAADLLPPSIGDRIVRKFHFQIAAE